MRAKRCLQLALLLLAFYLVNHWAYERGYHDGEQEITQVFNDELAVYKDENPFLGARSLIDGMNEEERARAQEQGL